MLKNHIEKLEKNLRGKLAMVEAQIEKYDAGSELRAWFVGRRDELKTMCEMLFGEEA